jgi:hypothetical protein
MIYDSDLGPLLELFRLDEDCLAKNDLAKERQIKIYICDSLIKQQVFVANVNRCNMQKC